jgi:hypothetical protein
VLIVETGLPFNSLDELFYLFLSTVSADFSMNFSPIGFSNHLTLLFSFKVLLLMGSPVSEWIFSIWITVECSSSEEDYLWFPNFSEHKICFEKFLKIKFINIYFLKN